MGEVRFISETNPVRGSHAYQQSFQLWVSQKDVFFPKLVVLLSSPDHQSLLLALLPLNSLITSDYSKTLDVPTTKNQMITINEAGRSIGWASMSFPLWIDSLVQVLCENADKIRWCPIRHETRVVVNENAHFPRDLVNHKKRWYTFCWLRQVVLTTDLLKCPPVYWWKISVYVFQCFTVHFSIQ